MERKLDWYPKHDPRSRGFALRSVVPTGIIRRNILWKPGTVLDQGEDGACVGFGWTHEALASPVRVDLKRAKAVVPQDPDAFARWVYTQARKIDEWVGEDYDGTSVLAGAKIMQGAGFLSQYRWAFSVEDVIDALMTRGPVVIGVWWYTSMFEPDLGNVLDVYGLKAGGHCVLVVGYKLAAPELHGEDGFWIQNSWGPGWGKNGLALISKSNMKFLLADEGEACVPFRRSYGRLAPQLVR